MGELRVAALRPGAVFDYEAAEPEARACRYLISRREKLPNAIVDHVNGNLRRSHDVLDHHGVITAMNKIIAEVYLRNAARHDPVLGDDATTFGITTSRNIANLAVSRLKGLPGVHVRLVDTALEVLCAGYVLRQYKLPGSTCDVSVDGISWEDSDAKLDGAVANSSAGQLTLDADLDGGSDAFAEVIPLLRHLRLVHAGDLESGECVIYLGIPRDNREGGRPWFDVARIHGNLESSGGLENGTGGPRKLSPADGPRYDELPMPEIELSQRPAAPPGEVRLDVN